MTIQVDWLWLAIVLNAAAMRREESQAISKGHK